MLNVEVSRVASGCVVTDKIPMQHVKYGLCSRVLN